MFRSKQEYVSPGKLPTCHDALHKMCQLPDRHLETSLHNSPEIPEPTAGHGCIKSDGQLSILWLTCAPAPDVVLSLMSCKCACSCTAENCTSVGNAISCTPACNIQNCESVLKVDVEDAFLNDCDGSEIDQD